MVAAVSSEYKESIESNTSFLVFLRRLNQILNSSKSEVSEMGFKAIGTLLMLFINFVRSS
jgi:hypothetical protein